MPGGARVGGVVQALVAELGPNGIHQGAFIRLGDRGHNELRFVRAPGKSGEALAEKTVVLRAQVVFHIRGRLDQLPGAYAVHQGIAQDSGAVVGVERIVRVSGAGQDRTRSARRGAGPARLHAERSNADGSVAEVAQGGQGIGKRQKRDVGDIGGSRIRALPDSAAGGSYIKDIAGRVGGVQRQRCDAPGNQAGIERLDSQGPQCLPGCGRLPLALGTRLRGSGDRPAAEMRGSRPSLHLPFFPSPLGEKPLRLKDARRTMDLLQGRCG